MSRGGAERAGGTVGVRAAGGAVVGVLDLEAQPRRKGV